MGKETVEKPEAPVEEKFFSPEHKEYVLTKRKAAPLVVAIRMGQKLSAARIKTLMDSGDAKKIATAKKAVPLTPAEEKLVYSVPTLKDAAFAAKKYRLNLILDVRDYILPNQKIVEDEEKEGVHNLTALRRYLKGMVTTEIERISAAAGNGGEIDMGSKSAANKSERAKLREQKLKAKIMAKADAKVVKVSKKEKIKGQIAALKAQLKDI